MCVKEDTHSPYLKVYTASVSAPPPPPPPPPPPHTPSKNFIFGGVGQGKEIM